MTREEREKAIALLQSNINWSKQKKYPYISANDANIYQSIIELLEQEPCEPVENSNTLDCIGRLEVSEQIYCRVGSGETTAG